MHWFFRLDKKENSNNNSEKYRHKCFQYAAAVALNYEEMEWNPKRVSNIKPFINEWTGKEQIIYQE